MIIDVGIDASVPLILYAGKASEISAIDSQSLTRISLKTLLERYPDLKWENLMSSGIARAEYILRVTHPWSSDLTAKMCSTMEINIPLLIRSGLTWELVAETGRTPDWFRRVIGAKAIDFDYIPGDILRTGWTREDVEEAFNLRIPL